MNSIENPFSDIFVPAEPNKPVKVTTEEINNPIKKPDTNINPNATNAPPWETNETQTISNQPVAKQPVTRPTVSEVEEVVADIINKKSDPTASMPKFNIPTGKPVFQPSQQPNQRQTQYIQQSQQTQESIHQNQPIQQQTSPVFDNYTNDKDAKKYKIFDLYWFINSKLYSHQQLGEGESPLLSISYNIDFDNLRFTFARPLNPDTINNTNIELNSVEKLCTFNVYPEIVEQLLVLMNRESGQVRNFERLFKRNPTWTPPQAGFKKDNDGLHIISSNGSTHTFLLSEQWQLNAFKRSLIFAVDNAQLLKISKFQN